MESAHKVQKGTSGQRIPLWDLNLSPPLDLDQPPPAARDEVEELWTMGTERAVCPGIQTSLHLAPGGGSSVDSPQALAPATQGQALLPSNAGCTQGLRGRWMLGRHRYETETAAESLRHGPPSLSLYLGLGAPVPGLYQEFTSGGDPSAPAGAGVFPQRSGLGLDSSSVGQPEQKRSGVPRGRMVSGEQSLSVSKGQAEARHGSGVSAASYQLLYECHVCGRRFEKPQALGGHMSSHTRGTTGAQPRRRLLRSPPAGSGLSSGSGSAGAAMFPSLQQPQQFQPPETHPLLPLGLAGARLPQTQKDRVAGQGQSRSAQWAASPPFTGAALPSAPPASIQTVSPPSTVQNLPAALPAEIRNAPLDPDQAGPPTTQSGADAPAQNVPASDAPNVREGTARISLMLGPLQPPLHRAAQNDSSWGSSISLGSLPERTRGQYLRERHHGAAWSQDFSGGVGAGWPEDHGTGVSQPQQSMGDRGIARWWNIASSSGQASLQGYDEAGSARDRSPSSAL